MKNWICLGCKPNIFPFSNLDNKKILELSSHNLDKFSRENLTTNNFSNDCNICKKKLNTNNKGVPCSNCKCRIHIKCANVNPKTFHLFRGNWQCKSCTTTNFPFTNIDDDSLQELKFNSIATPTTKKFHPETTVDDKLKLMLSYSKQSPWYAYTHPNEQEHDFFTAEINDSMTMKPKFDYYDIDEFKKVKTLWNNKKSLSIFHTNICSLQANINNLEDLLHDLDHSFDVIALSETWNPEKTCDTFLPKKLEGYLDYYGTEGSSLKGGCGFYVKNSFLEKT